MLVQPNCGSLARGLDRAVASASADVSGPGPCALLVCWIGAGQMKVLALRVHHSAKVFVVRPSRRATVSVRKPVVSVRMRVNPSTRASASAVGAPFGKRARTASAGVVIDRIWMSRPVAAARCATAN